jgi:hypothetical protein
VIHSASASASCHVVDDTCTSSHHGELQASVASAASILRTSMMVSCADVMVVLSIRDSPRLPSSIDSITACEGRVPVMCCAAKAYSFNCRLSLHE